MTRAELVEKIGAAIASMEGWDNPTARNRRNHNPGNLRMWGNVKREDGFAVFPSDEAGFEALYTQIRKNIRRGLTMFEFFGGKPLVYAGYAPDGDGNHAHQYAEYVASRCGIPPDVPLDTIGEDA